jgi:peroxiredoxin Q/BCP
MTWLFLLAGALVAYTLVTYWRNRTLNRPLPAVGAPAPSFELPDANGALRSLASLRGAWVVLYFYPRDGTAQCTRQACAFRDASEALAARGARVVGVSVDAPQRHQAFAARHRLGFLLLSDRGGSVAARYGSLLELGFTRAAKRNGFLIDPQGKVARTYPGADPGKHAAQVLADLDALGARPATGGGTGRRDRREPGAGGAQAPGSPAATGSARRNRRSKRSSST